MVWMNGVVDGLRKADPVFACVSKISNMAEQMASLSYHSTGPQDPSRPLHSLSLESG